MGQPASLTVDCSAPLRITMALRRPRKTMKMRPSFHRRSGAGRSPGAGARFPTQGRTEGIGPWQFVFIAMTIVLDTSKACAAYSSLSGTAVGARVDLRQPYSAKYRPLQQSRGVFQGPK